MCGECALPDLHVPPLDLTDLFQRKAEVDTFEIIKVAGAASWWLGSVLPTSCLRSTPSGFSVRAVYSLSLSYCRKSTRKSTNSKIQLEILTREIGNHITLITYFTQCSAECFREPGQWVFLRQKTTLLLTANKISCRKVDALAISLMRRKVKDLRQNPEGFHKKY